MQPRSILTAAKTSAVKRDVSRFVANVFRKLGYTLISNEVYDSFRAMERSSQGLPPEIISSAFQSLPSNLLILEHGMLQLRDQNSVFWPTHDSGLFSCLTTTLNSLLFLAKNHYSVSNICNKFNMNFYKDIRYSSTWNFLFKEPINLPFESLNFLLQCREPATAFYLDQHGSYNIQAKDCQWSMWLYSFLDSYLTPADQVFERSQEFINRYGLANSEIATVYYRGTDKSKEIAHVPLSSYFSEIDTLIYKSPDVRLLIQTDEYAFWHECSSRYGRHCFRINEMPLSTTSQPTFSDSNSRLQDGIDLIAMVKAIGRTSHLITNSGNVALFLSIEFARRGFPIIQLI